MRFIWFIIFSFTLIFAIKQLYISANSEEDMSDDALDEKSIFGDEDNSNSTDDSK